MGKHEQHRADLKTLLTRSQWLDSLRSGSALPGPRANLELVAAAAEEADANTIHYLASLTPEQAPSGTAEEFLPVCGAVGLGRLLATGETAAIPILRHLASDPRWRVREGVAMALQRCGDSDFPALLAVAADWSHGNPYEQRAAAAGLCEPRLLSSPERTVGVLAVLDHITGTVPPNANRRSEASGPCAKAWPTAGA